jgi:glutathione S-transferase
MLCLQNSAWAKRIYVRFKWRHPRYAAWTDRVMRRASAARKRERAAVDAIKKAAFHGKTPENRRDGN